MMQSDPPLVRVLPRQPGTKESRYKHLLAGDVEDAADVAQPRSSAFVASHSHDADRITHLENLVSDLRKEVADLKQQLANFRKQFE
jgi:uncharacterized protein YceH (UPF0502 family)